MNLKEQQRKQEAMEAKTIEMLTMARGIAEAAFRADEVTVEVVHEIYAALKEVEPDDLKVNLKWVIDLAHESVTGAGPLDKLAIFSWVALADEKGRTAFKRDFDRTVEHAKIVHHTTTPTAEMVLAIFDELHGDDEDEDEDEE